MGCPSPYHKKKERVRFREEEAFRECARHLPRAGRRSPRNRIVAALIQCGQEVVKIASRAPRESAFCWQFA
jgi:hypothetical protein